MSIIIREVKEEEHKVVGEMMVKVYSNLSGFPSPKEQPDYYKMLLNVGELTDSENVQLFIADVDNEIQGAVLYINDMKAYGSGSNAVNLKGAGFRLLAVKPAARGNGFGKMLSLHCIKIAKKNHHDYLYIHTTDTMKLAWGMYERLGFERYKYLDFSQKGIPVYGFRMPLS